METIGDAYIAVSGLQRLSKGGRRDHASSIAEMALAMVEAIPAINRRNLELIGQEINIRIGKATKEISSGFFFLVDEEAQSFLLYFPFIFKR